MQNFLKFISEGITNVPDHDTIDTNVWMTIGAKEPILSDEIHKQIMMDLESVRDIVIVEACYMAGDLLTKHWLDNTDMDIFIIVSKDFVSPIVYEKLMKFTQSRANRFAGHTQHLLKYYIEIVDDSDALGKFKDSLPGIYDVIQQKWVKSPISSVQTDVIDKLSVFLGRVRQIGMDSSASVNWDYFLSVNDDNIQQLRSMVMARAYEIDMDLAKEPDGVKKQIRKFAFGETPNIDEIQKLYDKGKIPPTIMQKLALRFYLAEYLKRLDDKAGENKLTTDNVLPPDSQSENRFDPFPRDNIPESVQKKATKSFSMFLESNGLRKPYSPKGMGETRRSGIKMGLSSKSESKSLTDKKDRNNAPIVNSGVMHGDLLAAEAKKKDSCCIPITDQQEKDIEVKYHITRPNEKYPFRRLGKTDGMGVIRKAPTMRGEKESIFLIKNDAVNGIGGGTKK